VKLVSHLKRSPFGVYYFRLVIPRRLRPQWGGRGEIKRSLGTKEPALARRYAYILSASVNEWVNQVAGQPLMANKEQQVKLLLQSRAEAVKDYNWHQETDAPGQMFWTPDGIDHTRGNQWHRQVAFLIDHITKIDAKLIQLGVKPPEDQFAFGVPGALSTIYRQPAVQPAVSVAPSTNSEWGARLSEGVATFLEVEAAGTAAPKTRMAVEKALSRFQSWVKAHAGGGRKAKAHAMKLQPLEADPALAAIEAPHIVAYMQHMLTAEAAGRGGVAKIQARGGEAAKLGLSKASVYKELGFLNGFFQSMQRLAHFPKTLPIPTKGITPYKRGEKKRSARDKSYLPFDESELNAIFEPSRFNALTKPHEYWVPILGLFTGARIDELAQLRLKDVRTEGEYTVLEISHTDETSTKNVASERTTPLHRDVLALGFLEYVADVKKVAGAKARLFPYLLETVHGFADVPSEAFARHLKAVGVKDGRKVFHSFRSTLNNELTKAGVPEQARNELLGHAHDSTNVVHYAGRLKPERLYSETLAKVGFDSIIKPLIKSRYTSGRFVAVLRKEIQRRKAQQENKAARLARGLPPLRSNKSKRQADL